jgi:hypothetical protein
MSEALENLSNRVFFHGTGVREARSILRRGFRVWRRLGPERERVPGDGNLGRGIYVTCDHRVALWFGRALLRVELVRGTRILDASVPPDPKVIRHLAKEFGREILKAPPWKALPRNKRLTLPELVALLRYHYVGTWETGVGPWRWPRKRAGHLDRLDELRRILVRYGFHGFGNPADDNGIVVFAEDRLVARELLAVIPRQGLPDELPLSAIVRRYPPPRA